MRILTFLMAAAIITSLSARAQQDGGRITGLVLDESGKPVESASVSLLRARDSGLVKVFISDKAGKYEFTGMPYGRYLVSASEVSHSKLDSRIYEITSAHPSVSVENLVLPKLNIELKEVAVTARKPFIEQKADRMVVNVDASPTNAGTTVMEVLEKSPGVTIDKDDNISLKGKQNVMIMIDGKPTYLNATQLADYLKSLPSSAVDQIEIMTNPSAKYDAAGNSGIINIKTKKNKAKGFNGNVVLTQTQGVYPKPSGSLNMNLRNGKTNFFLNAGYSHWEGFQNLDITRKYLDGSSKEITSIFTQQSHMHFINPELNLKFGMDYYLDNKTTLGFVVSGFGNNETNQSTSTIYLKDPNQVVDSIVYSPSNTLTRWRNASFNLNFRHQYDSSGRELTADADYVKYHSTSDQYFHNITYYPDWTEKGQTILTGNLPSDINIYSFKTDYTQPLRHDLKLEAGLKASYVETDNTANYYNVINNVPEVDTTKTNRFLYRENINAAYVNMTRQLKKWTVQAGIRLENTNYSGHQLGNAYTVNNNDSLFQKSYVNLFPTVYLSYQASEKNQFSLNYGRRIDRPAYQDLNPFLFFLDEYTYQAGNPYLQPQYTNNVEFSHTYNNFLTTTLNYSYTKNYFAETFEQQGQATIVRNGNIGQRQNAGIAVSAQVPVTKWWTAIIYVNANYNKYNGLLYGENLNVAMTTFLGNMSNQFKFNKGWGGEISGFYRTKGIEGQIIVMPLGQASAAVTKQLMSGKASLKLGIRDIFYTNQVSGYINFQQTEATFHNSRDSRQASLSFTYRFGKPIKGAPQHRNTGGASDESNRVKAGGNSN
jgi:outer membrane receptor protein involved in Fe transport